MEAGFSRMNALTVIQASQVPFPALLSNRQGLSEYVLRHVANAKLKGVVLGRDHRHHSDTFMRLTAAAFLARGFKVYYFKNFLNHTPLVPYGVKKMAAACGVMITASHVPLNTSVLTFRILRMTMAIKCSFLSNITEFRYWDNACQIIPPHDTGIQDSIMANLIPQSWDTSGIDTDPRAFDVTDHLLPAYVNDVVDLAFRGYVGLKSA
jgi:hypothetical protein